MAEPAAAAAPEVDLPADGIGAERTEELRLALVMNGGVSLAVWMGGVAFELNRLVRETHPVYRGLLELTGTAARIDVVSGASAGGINGAAIALAQVHDSSLYGLRDVWLNTAGLEQLMRQPTDRDPTSLLRGDDFFLPRIQDAFKALAGEDGPAAAPPAATPRQPPVMLSLSSTLLDGKSVKRLDDFGAIVEDTVHRARWTFERKDEVDDFAGATIVEQLARAARASASFPVAFEPSLFDPADKAYAGSHPLRVRLLREEPVTEPTLLLDGGILDNRPFEAALEHIARLPAQGTTRRVLAYVVPDPAAAAERRLPDPATGQLLAPSLAQVAWRSLVSIPASQSIASNLETLRKHNDESGRRWQRLVGAMRHMGAAVLMEHAGAGLQAYRARRVDGIADYLLGEIETGLAAGRGGRDMAMRRATRQWLRSTWQATISGAPTAGADRGVAAAVASHAGVWDQRVPRVYAPGEPLLMGPEPHWPWGLYAVDFLAEFTIELLRRTQRLNGLVKRWVEGASIEDAKRRFIVDGPALTRESELQEGATWEQQDLAPSPVGKLRLAGQERLGDAQLRDAWSEAFALAAEIGGRRRLADDETQRIGASSFSKMVDRWAAQPDTTPPAPLALELLQSLLCISPEKEAQNVAAAWALCTIIDRLQPIIREVVETGQMFAVRGDIAEAVAELAGIAAFCFDELPGDCSTAVDRIAWRLLAVEVFEVSAASRTRAGGAQAEVVQISARFASAWGGSDEPSAKVNGMQLAHFGAFYKRSWRANDWTFGRLDGIDRAVRVALNPDALQRRFGGRMVKAGGAGRSMEASLYVQRFLYGLAVRGAEPELRGILDAYWEADKARIVEELRWLDGDATLPPPLLEACARALARRLQLEALRSELPEIAISLLGERENGAPPSAAGIDLLARIAPNGKVATPSPADAVTLIRNDLLGADSIATQQGSDLFTRTAVQGLATTHAALASRHSGLTVVQALFKVTEWPVRILHVLTNRLSRGGRSAAAIEAGALGVGLALVGAALLTQKVPGAVVGFGWALLAGVTAATLLRQAVLGVSMLLVLLIGAIYLQSWPLLQILVATGIALLALQTRFGAVLAAVAIVLGAAWWSADGSMEALRLLAHQSLPGFGAPPRSIEPALQADADRLRMALGPALILVLLLLASAASRSLMAHVDRSGLGRAGSEASSLLRRKVDLWQAAWKRERERLRNGSGGSGSGGSGSGSKP